MTIKTVNSHLVTTDQKRIHKNLHDLILKHQKSLFKKPFSDFSLETFSKIQTWVSEKEERPLILDLGCGVGESSYHLALNYPELLIVGIDKSLDRIKRNNKFKQNLPENMLLVRGDLIDLLRLFAKSEQDFHIQKINIFYPNPYPKQKHLKLRWHGQNIFSTMMSLSDRIEVRSNWKLYLEEFKYAAALYGSWEQKLEQYIPEIMITPFERKYANSNHQLYYLTLKRLY